ncbi:MAG: hypothetical protein KDA60_12465 [Planctomycetales bacterium]|nr:hypothetical protein [Planctomycetales bacterium]
MDTVNETCDDTTLTKARWCLVNELGRQGVNALANARTGPLTFPTYAVAAGDGTYLISEETHVEKQIPFRFECRTIRVDQSGRVLLDTMTLGIEDGFGCLLDDGRVAILRRTKWELLLTGPTGESIQRIELARFSKRIPRFATWTIRGTFLIVFYNRSFDLDIIEVDLQGRLLWYLPRGAGSLGIAGSVQLLPSDHVLVADPFRHRVVELDREGNVVRQYGQDDHPSAVESRLSSPTSGMEMVDGRIVVADTRNHRVMIIDSEDSARPLPVQEGMLCDPTYVQPTHRGTYLICDTGNSRVLEVDETGHPIWSYGASQVGHRCLSYPRSVDILAADHYLVADTAHDRVVDFTGGRIVPKPFHGDPPLFWPRCVRILPSGSLLIADARNRRIVEVSPDGEALHQLTAFGGREGAPFHDPHDVQMLSNGHLLVTDSTRDIIVEVDWDGHAYAVIGENDGIDLDDPHSAQQLDDGSVLISDTGHHRILLVAANGKLVREWKDLKSAVGCYRFHLPRYAEVCEDGTLAIADTGNNRVLAATLDGEFLWEFCRVPGSTHPFLSQPRWVRLINRDEAVICDHFHHRVVHVKRERDSNSGN